ncbi:hypothetical protein BVRB_4g091740 [Beta vulgaris subsp. vulgaris]|nr:hypothetical protein BVRB_4g091740 [Beta vulgaris subsp. vulgaris]
MCMVLLSGFSSASAYSSDQLQHPRISVGRNLLQVLKDCPIDVENLNYTVITSKCKGPRYPPNLCCEAYRELACPYSVEVNDLTNNCATTMFSYINLYGRYPPGLFANVCRDSRRGLECTDAQVSKFSPATPSNSTAAPSPTIVLSFFLPMLYYMLL